MIQYPRYRQHLFSSFQVTQRAEVEVNSASWNGVTHRCCAAIGSIRSRKPAGVCWRFCAEAAWVLFGAYIQFKDVVVVGSISYIYYLVLIDPF